MLELKQLPAFSNLPFYGFTKIRIETFNYGIWKSNDTKLGHHITDAFYMIFSFLLRLFLKSEKDPFTLAFMFD